MTFLRRHGISVLLVADAVVAVAALAVLVAAR